MNTAVRGILYVSVWVVVWGVASSLVDWVLLSGEVYEMGSFGQVATFIGYGAACSVLAVRLSDRKSTRQNSVTSLSRMPSSA